MDTGLNFLMFLSAAETALLIIMWMYIWEMKMRFVERINRLEAQVFELTNTPHLQQSIPVEDYDRQIYRQKVQRLLDMALVRS